MKLFRIDRSINRKEIGRYPQCEDVIIHGNADAEDAFKYQGKYGPVVGQPPLPEPILHKSAKLTDYLSGTGIGDDKYKIISLRFYEFLASYLGPHQTWPIQVSNSELRFDRRKLQYVVKDAAKLKKYDYMILHISYSSHRLINYPESEFFIDRRERYMENAYDLPSYVAKYGTDLKRIYSHEEYISFTRYLRYHKGGNILVLKKLVINLSDNKESIFRIMTPMNNLSGYYVTETLRTKIEAEGFTGMAFTPLEELNPHVVIKTR